ncbi:TPA: hypothetical protein RPW15_001474 [Campylobacter fetus subsp. venerealis]|nr:hypothetical protein [Campylobacter fetus subsp. venerealis]HDX6253955.1 hypothetical protein [Campylobacter fetus subsp. venerealis]HDX6258143.1 hypothetical protein [Campylobacter fetus subsp. venerealis]HDX6261802.1 hypothetical protein [Campylobacter fetus subsp. venerealis]HDX6263932.1 hypothetical protein [Campylobacter fetus subsp. venerealis]
MKRAVFYIALALFFVGCSGKVQTNPLPKQEEIVIPSKYAKQRNVGINKSLINDFDRYAGLILSNKNFDDESVTNLDEDIKTQENYQEVTNPRPRVNLWQSGLDIAKKKAKK